MLRYLLLFSSLLMLSACFAQKKAKKSEQARIEYGMTHDEVLTQIKDRSELMVGEFDYPEGHMVAYQYTRYGKAGLKAPKYYLYFLNDTLVRKSDPEPLRKGSKLALQDHEDWLTEQAEQREDEAALAAKRAKLEEERAARDEHPKEKKGFFRKKKHKAESEKEE